MSSKMGIVGGTTGGPVGASHAPPIFYSIKNSRSSTEFTDMIYHHKDMNYLKNELSRSHDTDTMSKNSILVFALQLFTDSLELIETFTVHIRPKDLHRVQRWAW